MRPREATQIVDNEALMAMSAVVGALRELLVQKGIVTDDELDKTIRGIIRTVPADPETKRRVMFLALGPGGDIEVVGH